MTSALDTASGSASALSRLGGGFMLDPATYERGQARGYGYWPFYYGGRAGVLGDVHADVVAASLFFIPLEMVRKGWDRAREVGPLCDAGLAFREACRDWGRAQLADVEGLERLVGLVERVVTAAEPLNAPVFAGWRALALPDDAPARLAQLLHVLREHRGAMHAVAVQASGLTPLEATATSKLAAASLQLFSWPQPWPEVTEELQARRKAAESLTDELCAPAYAVLTEEEGAELVRLLNAAKARVFPKKS